MLSEGRMRLRLGSVVRADSVFPVQGRFRDISKCQ
jgi:hypothetical protein